MTLFGDLPAWLPQAAFSIMTLVASYLAGHVLKWVVGHRLTTLTSRTKGQWDDVVVRELARRVPFWSLLLGVYLASGLWTLPPHISNVLDKTLFVLIAVSATFFSAAIVAQLTLLYGSTLQHALPITSLTHTIAKVLVYTIGLLMILNGLGLSITPILTALGVGGLAVALALQDTLANLFAGVYITLAGQIRLNDYVRLDSGQEGYIVDIGWRSTRIRMLPNNMVLVPNSKLSQAIVTNYSLPALDIAIALDVGVDYDSDLSEVERVVCDVGRDVMRSVPGGVPDFDPIVRFHTFGSSSIDFTVILRGREFVDQYLVKHEFVKRLHARFKKEGIVIPFPIRTLASREPIQVSVVSTRG
jgi:small-conductance mechanosensitive channel